MIVVKKKKNNSGRGGGMLELSSQWSVDNSVLQVKFWCGWNWCKTSMIRRWIWQKSPGIAVHNPKRYYCARKEKFALLLMANWRRSSIDLLDISCTLSTHDSLAWTKTLLTQRIAHGELPHQFFLLGDNTFVCSQKYDNTRQRRQF